MIHFAKNTGQFHPMVAWVANVDSRDPKYHGAGIVELIREGTKFVSFEYGHTDSETPAECEAEFPGRHFAYASCYQLVVDHGTGTAAILNLTVHG